MPGHEAFKDTIDANQFAPDLAVEGLEDPKAKMLTGDTDAKVSKLLGTNLN